MDNYVWCREQRCRREVRAVARAGKVDKDKAKAKEEIREDKVIKGNVDAAGGIRISEPERIAN